MSDRDSDAFFQGFRAWVVARRTDRNGNPRSDEEQSISADELLSWQFTPAGGASQGLDPVCVDDLLRGDKRIKASQILVMIAKGWRPLPPAKPGQ